MPDTTPVALIPGTLPYADGCYPADPQALNVAIVTRIQAFLSETFPGIYKGATAPPVDQRNRLWYNTTVGRWYEFTNGNWMRQYQFAASSDLEMIWAGTEAELATFDGGDSNAVGDFSGPLWRIDHEFDGRTLIGAGTIPDTDPAVTIAQGAIVDSTGLQGTYKHVLTGPEGAVADHIHPFGLTNPAGDDAYFNRSGVNTVEGYSGYYITGSNGNIVTAQTTADLFTSKAALGAGLTSVGHNNMQPYRARYVIRRTARIWVLSPY